MLSWRCWSKRFTATACMFDARTTNARRSSRDPEILIGAIAPIDLPSAAPTIRRLRPLSAWPESSATLCALLAVVNGFWPLSKSIFRRISPSSWSAEAEAPRERAVSPHAQIDRTQARATIRLDVTSLAKSTPSVGAAGPEQAARLMTHAKIAYVCFRAFSQLECSGRLTSPHARGRVTAPNKRRTPVVGSLMRRRTSWNGSSPW